jgi:prolyl oligopeptidase
VPRVPFLDILGATRTPYGRASVELELGDPTDAQDVLRLASYSPYQNVMPRPYPAVYLDAGQDDSRCPAWHARKFAATLQAAQQGERPILLYVRQHAGHGLATPWQVRSQQDADWLAFVMRELGLLPESR